MGSSSKKQQISSKSATSTVQVNDNLSFTHYGWLGLLAQASQAVICCGRGKGINGKEHPSPEAESEYIRYGERSKEAKEAEHSAQERENFLKRHPYTYEITWQRRRHENSGRHILRVRPEQLLIKVVDEVDQRLRVFFAVVQLFHDHAHRGEVLPRVGYAAVRQRQRRLHRAPRLDYGQDLLEDELRPVGVAALLTHHVDDGRGQVIWPPAGGLHVADPGVPLVLLVRAPDGRNLLLVGRGPGPAPALGPEAGPDIDISDEFMHDGMFNELVAGFGMDLKHHAKMYEYFQQLPEEQKAYYNFAHVEALQKYRDKLSIDPANNKKVSAMRHLTEDEKRRLLDTCAQRIYVIRKDCQKWAPVPIHVSVHGRQGGSVFVV
ncbi:hypothetical protein DL767_010988 [Monosporascus sp. MG133]|nr:hypothetical protein DL767_010988 [Monosporascus sp. MG133]